MNTKSILLGVALFCASFTNAQPLVDKQETTFPVTRSTYYRTPEVMKPTTHSINEDHESGLSMWATTVFDYFRNNSIVHFYSGNPNQLERVGKPFSDDEVFKDSHYIVGCWIKDAYYGFLSVRFSNFLQPMEYVKTDLVSGTYTTLQSYRNVPATQINPIEAMTYDQKNDEVYALARPPYKSTEEVTSIGIIDRNTGRYTELKKLDYIYISLACDMDGMLWAARYILTPTGNADKGVIVTLDPQNNFKEEIKCTLRHDGSNFPLWWPSSMAFDNATGDMWMLANNGKTAYQQVARIDVNTGMMYSNGVLGYGDIGTGLHIPFKAPDARDAAFSVSNLGSTYDNEGKVTLHWTNPTKTWDKQDLTDLYQVKVYRDGQDESNVVATLDASGKVGSEMTWKDETATEGIHEYTVIPFKIADQKGIQKEWRAFTGEDVPGMPVDVNVKMVDRNTATITWNDPIKGKLDGYYNKAELSYDVIRYPDSVKVASDLKEKTFTDRNIKRTTRYHWEVIAKTTKGVGLSTKSDYLKLGDAYEIPYTTTINTQDKADEWTLGGKHLAEFGYVDYGDVKGIKLFTFDNFDYDAFIISPNVKLVGGKTYRFHFDVVFSYAPDKMYYPELNHNFKVTVGQGNTVEAQSNVLSSFEHVQVSKQGESRSFEGVYQCPADGEYNFALNIISSKNRDALITYRAWAEEVLPKDLAAENVTPLNLEVMTDKNTYFDVDVYNKGQKSFSSYNVQVVRKDGDNTHVLGEVTVNEKLEAGMRKTVRVEGKSDIAGNIQVQGKVVGAGDMNETNNMTEVKNLVAVEGKTPFNVHLDGAEKRETSTRIPMAFNYNYTQSQIIYWADELGQQDATTDVLLSGIAFEYEADVAVPSFGVNIYAGSTDEIVGKENTFVPTSELTKVYSGNAFIEKGSNKMIFRFDEDFLLDPTKNLLIVVEKNGQGKEDFYPARFALFNVDWESGLEYRSILYNAYKESEPTTTNTQTPGIPVTHFAIKSNITDAIQDVVVGSDLRIKGNVLYLNSVKGEQLSVYNLQGDAVMQTAIKGQSSVNINLRQGLYILKVIDESGSVHVRKFTIK